MCDVPIESNVRKDTNEWQEEHATLVLSTVKVSSVLESLQNMAKWINCVKRNCNI